MVTDVMLKDAAIAAENALISMVPENCEAHEFSRRFEKKMKKLIGRVRNPSRYYMKRFIPVAAGVLAVLIGVASITGFKVSKRISFEPEGDLACDECTYVDENTVVINRADDAVPTKLPIYRIGEWDFTDEEYSQIQSSIRLASTSGKEQEWERDGNVIIGRADLFGDNIFSMTDEELEALAWETLNKIPHLNADYEYVGITGRHQASSSAGTVTNSVRVTFRPCVDGIRVTGDGACHMWFADSGLLEISIQRFRYKQMGTMDLIPLAEAEERINTPDRFSMGETGAYYVEQLDVEKVGVQLVNQHTRGCTILQPVYKFTGTATLEGNGTKTRFSSLVIAIPEFYTYG